jgi:hypothetical protein
LEYERIIPISIDNKLSVITIEAFSLGWPEMYTKLSGTVNVDFDVIDYLLRSYALVTYCRKKMGGGGYGGTIHQLFIIYRLLRSL